MIHDDNDDNDDNDDDGTLSPALRALLDAGGGGPAVPRGTADRLLGKVLFTAGVATTAASTAAAATTATTAATTAATAATTAATTATTTAATTAATTSASAAAGSLATAFGFKLVVGLAGVGALVSGGVVLSQRAASPAIAPAVVAAAPAPTQRVPAAPPATSGQEPATKTEATKTAATPTEPVKTELPPEATKTETTTETTKTETTKPETAKPETANDGEESALLEQARAALVRGDLEASLLALAEHSKRAPQGQLVEEREGLRVFVLQRAGRRADARRAATEFLQRFPDSVLGERVRAVAADEIP